MWNHHPHKMDWFAAQEGRDKGGQWKKEMPYSVIKNHKSQFELDLSEWESDCDSGHCGL
jgi:hypothetical protein